MTERVALWQAAWESRDADRVAALYAEDATHRSSRVAVIWPELGTTALRGVAQIRDYARRALARFTTLRFELLTVTEDPIRSAVEYHRHSNLDATPAHVLELIEWRGELIEAVRVFHYEGH
jgi:ketosteroid isomerase-like protein